MTRSLDRFTVRLDDHFVDIRGDLDEIILAMITVFCSFGLVVILLVIKDVEPLLSNALATHRLGSSAAVHFSNLPTQKILSLDHDTQQRGDIMIHDNDVFSVVMKPTLHMKGILAVPRA